MNYHLEYHTYSLPTFSALCGEQWPEMFTRSKKEWMKYVIPSLQHETLCRDCYEELKKIFPQGWRNAERNVFPKGVYNYVSGNKSKVRRHE
jgi:hypothetical protein